MEALTPPGPARGLWHNRDRMYDLALSAGGAMLVLELYDKDNEGPIHKSGLWERTPELKMLPFSEDPVFPVKRGPWAVLPVFMTVSEHDLNCDMIWTHVDYRGLGL